MEISHVVCAIYAIMVLMVPPVIIYMNHVNSSAEKFRNIFTTGVFSKIVVSQVKMII